MIAAMGHGSNPPIATALTDGAGRVLIGGVLPVIEDRYQFPEAGVVFVGADRMARTAPGADNLDKSTTGAGHPVEAGEGVKAPEAPVHLVGPRETLWSIAADHLGSAKRWREIARINYGTTQFDGSSLTEEHWILPGWMLRLPTESPSDTTDSTASFRDSSSSGSAQPVAGVVVDRIAHRCPIVDAPNARRNPWSSFPEGVDSVPHPGEPSPAVPLGGGIVGAGVVDLVDRLRRIQQRHREDGSFIKLPDRLRLQFERRLRAGEGASGPEAIDAALQLLAWSWERGTWPCVRGARILPDAVELVIDTAEERMRIPSPFVEVGGLLRVDRGLLASWHRKRSRGQRRAPVPTLVTAGPAGEGVLLVDLESLGSLVVSGEQASCENVIRALALELATSHWSGRFDVVLVGFGAEFERFDRVTSVSDPQPLALELCRRRLHGDVLRSGAEVESFAAARWFDDDACWAPLVVVCGPAVGDDAVQELLEVASDPVGGTAIVAAGSHEIGNSAAHSVRLTAGTSSAPLELLASVLCPQQVNAGEFAEVTAILDVAEAKESAPSSEGPYRDLQVPLPSTHPAASPDDGPSSTTRTVPFDRGNGVAGPTARVRVGDRSRHANGDDGGLDVLGQVSLVGTDANPPASESPAPLVRQVTDPSDPQSELREVEVLVLGPVEIKGAARDFTRAWARELVVYLAMHPRGASNDAWATALWPDRLMAPSSLHSTASVARRALGLSFGGVDHLPRSHGRLALGPTVGTDWDRFVKLADSGQPARWRSALDLVRGRPFEGLRSSDWPILEGIGPAIESSVVDLSGRLAGACLRAGDARGAEWSARKGLLVSPYDERLYRMLLRAADLAGNPAGVEGVMAELVRLVAEGVEPLESVHPSTLQLYRRLTRRRAISRPGSVPPSSAPKSALSGPSAPHSGDLTAPDPRSEGATS
jgi:DNA-binding SARP family transcriptional activator